MWMRIWAWDDGEGQWQKNVHPGCQTMFESPVDKEMFFSCRTFASSAGRYGNPERVMSHAPIRRQPPSSSARSTRSGLPLVQRTPCRNSSRIAAHSVT
jgi:hypothetical protein